MNDYERDFWQSPQTPKKSRRGLAFGVVLGLLCVSLAFNLGHIMGRAYAPVPVPEPVYELAELATEPPLAALPVATAAPPLSVAQVFRHIENAVVSINVTTPQRMFFGHIREAESAGSGLIFYENDTHIYIVTNYHVVENATNVTISLDDIRTAPANFVGAIAVHDLAVIRVSRAELILAGIRGYTVAEFADSDKIEIGNFAMAVGNAYGSGKSATLGIVSAIDRFIGIGGDIALRVLQTDAAINPGNSGGPLVDNYGRVIGINTAQMVSARSEGMSYAIPANDVSRAIELIMDGRADQAIPNLGIAGTTITEALRIQHGFQYTGVFVNGIYRDLAAHLMGIQSGDIITAVNGERIADMDELKAHIAQTPEGTDFELTILRQNDLITLPGRMTATRRSQTNF